MQTPEEIDRVVHRLYALAVVLPAMIALMTTCAETPKAVSKTAPEPSASDQATHVPEPPAPAAVPASAPRVLTAQDRTATGNRESEASTSFNGVPSSSSIAI